MEKLSISSFFGVIFRKKAYISILYLIGSFVLGTFYFTYFLSLLGLIIGLSITWLVIPLILLLVASSRGFAAIERWCASAILGEEIIFKKDSPSKKTSSVFEKMKSYVLDFYPWKAFAFHILKFPIGLFSLVSMLMMISISLSFISTPVFFILVKTSSIAGTLTTPPGWEFMNSYWFTFLFGLLGVLLLIVSFHMFNGIAYISSLLARAMLEKKGSMKTGKNSRTSSEKEKKGKSDKKDTDSG